MLPFGQMWKEDGGISAIRRTPRLSRIVVTLSRCMTDNVLAQRELMSRWEKVNPLLREISITRTQRRVKCGDGDWQLAKGSFRVGRV